MSEGRLNVIFFGGHCGDEALIAGGTLTAYAKKEHKVTVIHMTAGEKGNPTKSPEEYRKHKEKSARKAADIMGVDFRILDYKDAELPFNMEDKLKIAEIIRELKPNLILTHNPGSIHIDHRNAGLLALEGAFYAGIPSIKSNYPPHNVTSIYYGENWEDPIDFRPEYYVDISGTIEEKILAMKAYFEWIEKSEESKGESPHLTFDHIDYYRTLARLRGIESGTRYAECFMAPPHNRFYNRKAFSELPFPQPYWIGVR